MDDKLAANNEEAQLPDGLETVIFTHISNALEGADDYTSFNTVAFSQDIAHLDIGELELIKNYLRSLSRYLIQCTHRASLSPRGDRGNEELRLSENKTNKILYLFQVTQQKISEKSKHKSAQFYAANEELGRALSAADPEVRRIALEVLLEEMEEMPPPANKD